MYTHNSTHLPPSRLSHIGGITVHNTKGNDMKKQTTLVAASLIIAIGGISAMTVNAGAGHGDKPHGQEKAMAHGDSHGAMKMPKDMPMADSHAGHGGHAHDAWIDAPADYANKTWAGWGDTQAATRGKVIYQQQCSYCHGADGKGAGVLSDRLEHKPADLTNNFHTAPGKGDGYLFWRVTDGGTVDPFRGQNSAMPAFRSVLNEQARWDVLTYVHQAFHGGFPASMDGHAEHGGSADHHQDKGHAH